MALEQKEVDTGQVRMFLELKTTNKGDYYGF